MSSESFSEKWDSPRSQCTAKQQYGNGKQCERIALPGKSKCAGHGSGGVRTAKGRAAIAAAHSEGLNDSRATRSIYRQAISELYQLAKIAGINWIGRPPKV